MRHARGEINQSAGIELLGRIPDLDHATTLESHVAVGGAVRVGAGAHMRVIGRRAALVIVHLASLDRIGRREPAAIEKPDGGLGAEPANAAAARVAERAERLPIEEISRPPGQPPFDGGGRLGRLHVQQLQIRPRRFEPRRFSRGEQHTGPFLGCVLLVVEADHALLRRRHDVNQVIVVARPRLEPATFQHCSSVDGQGLRTAQTLAADRPFKSGFDRPGLGGVRIDD